MGEVPNPLDLLDDRKVTKGQQEYEYSRPGSRASHYTAGGDHAGQGWSRGGHVPRPGSAPGAGTRWAAIRNVDVRGCLRAAGLPPVPRPALPAVGERAPPHPQPRPSRLCGRGPALHFVEPKFLQLQVGRLPRAGPSSPGSCEGGGGLGVKLLRKLGSAGQTGRPPWAGSPAAASCSLHPAHCPSGVQQPSGGQAEV